VDPCSLKVLLCTKCYRPCPPIHDSLLSQSSTFSPDPSPSSTISCYSPLVSPCFLLFINTPPPTLSSLLPIPLQELNTPSPGVVLQYCALPTSPHPISQSRMTLGVPSSSAVYQPRLSLVFAPQHCPYIAPTIPSLVHGIHIPGRGGREACTECRSSGASPLPVLPLRKEHTGESAVTQDQQSPGKVKTGTS